MLDLVLEKQKDEIEEMKEENRREESERENADFKSFISEEIMDTDSEKGAVKKDDVEAMLEKKILMRMNIGQDTAGSPETEGDPGSSLR